MWQKENNKYLKVVNLYKFDLIKYGDVGNVKTYTHICMLVLTCPKNLTGVKWLSTIILIVLDKCLKMFIKSWNSYSVKSLGIFLISSLSLLRIGGHSNPRLSSMFFIKFESE